MPDLLDDNELATVLTAIDNMGQIMSGPAPTPQTRERADTALALLASAEQKLRAMHGLPTGPTV